MKKILVVDDEPLIRYSLAAVLRDSRTEVTTVAAGNDALRETGAGGYDLCFLDVHLPDISGLDVMKGMKALSPRTGIIVMTGSDLDQEAMQAVRENAILFLPKPFDLFRVKAYVARVLERDVRADSGSEFAQRPQGDRRRYEREIVAQTVTFSPAAGCRECGKDFTAEVVDVSDAGMGIRTACPVEPGCVVILDNGTGRKKGMVRWIMTVGGRDEFRAGMQFA